MGKLSWSWKNPIRCSVGGGLSNAESPRRVAYPMKKTNRTSKKRTFQHQQPPAQTLRSQSAREHEMYLTPKPEATLFVAEELEMPSMTRQTATENKMFLGKSSLLNSQCFGLDDPLAMPQMKRAREQPSDQEDECLLLPNNPGLPRMEQLKKGERFPFDSVPDRGGPSPECPLPPTTTGSGLFGQYSTSSYPAQTYNYTAIIPEFSALSMTPALRAC